MWLQEAYEDGAVIVQQGQPGDCMFVVQSGDVIARHRATGDMGSGTEVRVLKPPNSTKGLHLPLDCCSHRQAYISRWYLSITVCLDVGLYQLERFQSNYMFCFIVCKAANIVPGLLFPAFLVVTMTDLVSR